jgi:hypothetical protein
MLDHHIQRSIVYALAFTDNMRFSELQPSDIDNKLFTYHLKKVITAGLVSKTDDGHYTLTSEGRRAGKGALVSRSRSIDHAYSQLLLIIKRPRDGAWLLYNRATHPSIGLTGFMQASPIPDRSIADVAHDTCYAKTGLTGTFRVITNGYFTLHKNNHIESFTHFTLMASDDITGDLQPNDQLGTYYWDTDPDFTSPIMLPTVHSLSEAYRTNDPTCIEKTFTLYDTSASVDSSAS